MSFQLPNLPYAFNALEPSIDARTMEIHLTKHHGAYVTNLNTAIQGTEWEKKSIEDLISKINLIPENIRAAVRNNGGGHFNHSMFWKLLSPNGGGEPSGELVAAITKNFGSFQAFKEKFETAAKTRFGSGWAWLGVKDDGSLCVCSTPNQDNPLMDVADTKCRPILGLDVWEHAYYLNYQNRRPDYIAAFWKIVNWEEVAHNLSKAKSGAAVVR